MQKIRTENVSNLQEYMRALTGLDSLPNKRIERYFRGEPEDFNEGALIPSIYRNAKWLENEPNFYREMQRFNDQEFRDDKTAVDKLSRMQHYEAPSRLIDLSEDALSALYFALAATKPQKTKDKKSKTKKNSGNAVVYVIDVVSSKLCYYDSDKVSVIANLAKSPLNGCTQKSKEAIACDARKYRERIKVFNTQKSIHFLLHDIKEEKSYFSHIINPKHIFSVQCVKPKFTHTRINSQKGAFLLFGLNPNNIRKSIHLIEKYKSNSYRLGSNKNIQHPIERITKIVIKADGLDRMRNELESIGVRTPFIYPEMDKVAEYLKMSRKPEL